MSKPGVYYLGHLSKMGNLTTAMVIQALLKPTPVLLYGNAWSIVDAKEHQKNGIKYIVGRLAKYRPDAEVVIVDPARRIEMVQQEPNLRVASSPFIYIPSHQGVAFMRVSGQIEEFHFADRFARIIESTHNNFFVECKINLIADLKTFAMKLRGLSGIYRIAASVVPPNPAFGPLWKPLRDYIRKRRSGQMTIREDSKSSEPLKTELPLLVEKLAEQKENEPYTPDHDIDISDAAILMAADGYGTGHIKGYRGKEVVIIRTADTNRNFSFDKDPLPEKLFDEVYEILDRIQRERHMEHE
jgi:hypothetical protein